MAFTDFTSIAQVQETFDIKYTEEDDIQCSVDIEPSAAFLEESHLASNILTCSHQKRPVVRMLSIRFSGMCTKTMPPVFRSGAINLLLMTRN